MSRTNIEIDDALIEKVMLSYGFKTMREAVDFALRELVELDPKSMLELEGMGWEGDLDALRGRPPGAAPSSTTVSGAGCSPTRCFR